MADEKQLQDNQSQVADLIARLRAAGGQRGATYAGRVLTEKDTPESVMQRLPGGDVEEFGAMAGPLAGAGVAGITKAQLKAGIRPQTQIAQLARPGEMPVTPIHKLWPAAINETTGEIAHARQPGVGLHEPLLRSIKNSVRGWVDPVTWQAFTDKMLSAVGF
jgi:hypothetical protein